MRRAVKLLLAVLGLLPGVLAGVEPSQPLGFRPLGRT